MKKRTTRCLALLLAVVMVLSVMPVAMAEETAKTATLVTDASTLKVGDEIIIAAKDNDFAMGEQKTNNRAAVAVTKSEDKLTLTAGVQKLTLKQGAKENTFAFDTGSGYLYAASSSKNHLKTESKLSDNSSWSVAIADGKATVIAQGANTRNVMKYNSNSELFACYASGQQDIAIYKLETVPAPSNKVAAPTATPVAGEVAKGTKVEFKCKTEGAKISYKTTGEYTEYTDPVEVNADTTFTVKATKAGMDDSDEVKFAYTVKAEEPVQSLFKDGEQIVIYNPANMKALSTEYSGFYNKGTDVTLADGKLSGWTDADVWTVGVNADGSYTFSTKDGKKLSMGASYGSTPLDDVNTAWKVSPAATTGCYYIQNAVRGNYLEWYAEKSNWSSYNKISDELLFAQAFYRVRKSGIVTSLSEGDTVVVFNPANMKALSTEYSGFYNKGTDVTLADGKLSGYTKADIWTVGVNADGTYTFSTSEGKKLSMAEKYTSTPLDEVNTAWKVTAAKTENCFYIQNAVRGNYLEWYADKSNWSSYGSIGSNEALFAQQFYLVVDDGGSDEPSGDLPQPGDKFVIYNQNAQAVLAAENDSKSIEKAAATVADGKATPANGAVVFTVEQNGEYLRFKSEAYGYLCSNGTGNNAFYSKDFSEEGVTTDDADWLRRRGRL